MLASDFLLYCIPASCIVTSDSLFSCMPTSYFLHACMTVSSMLTSDFLHARMTTSDFLHGDFLHDNFLHYDFLHHDFLHYDFLQSCRGIPAPLIPIVRGTRTEAASDQHPWRLRLRGHPVVAGGEGRGALRSSPAARSWLDCKPA